MSERKANQLSRRLFVKAGFSAAVLAVSGLLESGSFPKSAKSWLDADYLTVVNDRAGKYLMQQIEGKDAQMPLTRTTRELQRRRPIDPPVGLGLPESMDWDQQGSMTVIIDDTVTGYLSPKLTADRTRAIKPNHIGILEQPILVRSESTNPSLKQTDWWILAGTDQRPDPDGIGGFAFYPLTPDSSRNMRIVRIPIRTDIPRGPLQMYDPTTLNYDSPFYDNSGIIRGYTSSRSVLAVEITYTDSPQTKVIYGADYVAYSESVFRVRNMKYFPKIDPVSYLYPDHPFNADYQKAISSTIRSFSNR